MALGSKAAPDSGPVAFGAVTVTKNGVIEDFPEYPPSHPDIPFSAALKAARQFLGANENEFFCATAHWFGIPQSPGKGYWGFNFWNRKKEYRSISVTPDGTAQLAGDQAFPWDFIEPSPLSLEDAIKIAEEFESNKKSTFLFGGGISQVTSVNVFFYTPETKDYTWLYVTFDGKVYTDQHATNAMWRGHRELEEEPPQQSSVSKPEYFTISGRVPMPGRAVWTPDLTLLKAILNAGGMTNPYRALIIRDGQRIPVDLNPVIKGTVPDPPLKPDDEVTVP